MTMYSKKNFGLAWLGEKLRFHTENFDFRERGILKKVFFIGLRSCPNQTKLGIEFQQCNESAKQKVVGKACLGKKWFLIRNFANSANCEFLRILKKFFFIGSRSCPNQTKLGFEYHQCNNRVKPKSCWYSLPRKKIGFHTEFCEFRGLRIFENFKNSCFSSGQGAAQIKPNSVLSITSVMTV